MADLRVTRNDDEHRYEGDLDGALALIDFQRHDDADPALLVITHTEVPDSMQGKGVGSHLVREALDDIRRRGERVRPDCPFVRSWIEEHPDYQDLIVP
ncbi:GNAT family N-acetyltransferase [soil metagenome]